MTKKEKKAKKNLSNGILNVIRTTMRNNIDLTHIADNKANVLLSLNALMITFLIPFIIPYLDIVIRFKLGFPIMILVSTNLVVIYIASLVLKPSRFYENQKEMKEGKYISPFFFGNYYKMGKEEFSVYIQEALSNEELVKNHITEDLHYIGTRLGQKMALIRVAFNIFLSGLFVSILMTIAFLYIFR